MQILRYTLCSLTRTQATNVINAPALSPVQHRALIARVWLVTALACSGSFAAAQATGSEVDAASHLVFESVLDGRCQILSDGGKLRRVLNTHPTRAIRYRAIRVFAGGIRQGRVTGRVPPANEPVKLGCTKVDGRAQDWELERAHFDDKLSDN